MGDTEITQVTFKSGEKFGNLLVPRGPGAKDIVWRLSIVLLITLQCPSPVILSF